MTELVAFKCGYCGKPNEIGGYFYRMRMRGKGEGTPLYCDKKCSGAARRAPVRVLSCPQCGKAFELRPHEYRKRIRHSISDQAFCSYACAYANGDRKRGKAGWPEPELKEFQDAPDDWSWLSVMAENRDKRKRPRREDDEPEPPRAA